MVVDKIRCLQSYCIKYIFPSFNKDNYILKHEVEKNIYSLLENVAYANYNKGSVREKYLKSVCVNISLLDCYFNDMKDNNIIKEKRFVSTIRYLNEIKKMVFGWIGSEKSK